MSNCFDIMRTCIAKIQRITVLAVWYGVSYIFCTNNRIQYNTIAFICGIIQNSAISDTGCICIIEMNDIIAISGIWISIIKNRQSTSVISQFICTVSVVNGSGTITADTKCLIGSIISKRPRSRTMSTRTL